MGDALRWRQRFEQLRERRRFDLQRVGSSSARGSRGSVALAEMTAAGRDAAPATAGDRQHEAAARDPAVNWSTMRPMPARQMSIGRERLRELELDLADVVLADDLGTIGSEQPGIDRVRDRRHRAARRGRPDAGDDLAADRERSRVQPEYPCAQPLGRGRRACCGRDHVAPLDEELAIERDADGMAGRRRARRVGGIGRRPRLDGPHPRVLLARLDHDVVADADAAALHPPGDDAAVVELVNRLHWETQRQIGGGTPR
jgi:hypothetical protein